MIARPTALPEAGAPDVLYLVDLSGYVFRAYHAIAPLSSPSGEPTHATYGTVNMLARLVGERRPAYLGVAMDSPGKTFRDELDARYKAHRPPPPADLEVQMRRCREIVEAYRIPIFAEAGLEADDFVATLVPLARKAGLRVVIASSDKDLMQLVDDGDVVMWDAMRDKVYGTPEVIEKFGVPPGQVRDLLALVGDSSDNVPGVPSVGVKTAAELLGTFGDLDALYARLDEVKKPRIRENLASARADAMLSRELVTLRTDAPVTMDLAELRYGGADQERLRDLFSQLGFTRLVKALPAPREDVHAARAELVTTPEGLAALARELREAGRFAAHVVLASDMPMLADVVGLSFATHREGATRAWYVPLGHLALGTPSQPTLAAALEALGPVLADGSIAKVAHDAKRLEVVLLREGHTLAGVVMDDMLAGYLLDPEADHGLGALSQQLFGAPLPSEPTASDGSGKKRGRALGVDHVPVDEAATWAGAVAAVTLRAGDKLGTRLENEGLSGLLTTLELPLSAVLARMERDGVLIDPAALDELGHAMSRELVTLEAKAREAAGQDLNLASPKQLEAILFDTLGLRATKKTKTGRSTDAEALEAIADDHPLPALVLEHRAVAKLKGTYVDALPRLLHPKTGRIHTRWSQAVAATGRISSQDPNLQNIPIRTPLGRLIRKAFVAPPGYAIVSADYSQIELRILAHLSRDEVLCDAFSKGEDVHVRTAMEVFGVPRDGVTDEMRRQSKTVNFGVIYGMGETALAKRLGIPRAEAARFIDAYFSRYSGVRAFFDGCLAEARRTEVVRTLLGRRRVLADLRSSDRQRRAQAERMAQNTPIQGTAADLLKLAMVRLAEPEVSLVKGARMVLTVHDELTFEVPEAGVAEAKARLRELMSGVMELRVPLVVDVGHGPTWAEAH